MQTSKVITLTINQKDFEKPLNEIITFNFPAQFISSIWAFNFFDSILGTVTKSAYKMCNTIQDEFAYFPKLLPISQI